MTGFDFSSKIKELVGKKVKIGRAGTREVIEGTLGYCDNNGNLKLNTENGYIIIQRQGWYFITNDLTQMSKPRAEAQIISGEVADDT